VSYLREQPPANWASIEFQQKIVFAKDDLNGKLFSFETVVFTRRLFYVLKCVFSNVFRNELDKFNSTNSHINVLALCWVNNTLGPRV
jgi:hypothetical protein